MCIEPPFLNRHLSLTDPKGNVTTWDYTTTPNVVVMTDLNNTETKTYRTDGQLASVESLYNSAGQLLSRVLTQGGVEMRIDFTYDANGRVLTQTRYSDAAGTTLVATTTFTYDEWGHVTSIFSTDSNDDTVDSFYYTYDVDQLADETDFQGEISGSSWTLNYTYDAQDQLTDDTNNTYDYDAGGNRDTGYTYIRNYANTHDTNEIASDGAWDYTYDGEGNITVKTSDADADEKWTYGYDNANHLIEAKHYNTSGTLDDVVDYSYDVFGNRVQKVVDDDRVSPHSPTTQRYAVDGWNPAKPSPVGNENFDVIADLDGSSSLTTRYLRGDTVDQLLGRVDDVSSVMTPYWHLMDHLGSVRDILDGDGDVVDSLRYDSFGNIDTGTETHPDYRGRYSWTGREFDVRP